MPTYSTFNQMDIETSSNSPYGYFGSSNSICSTHNALCSIYLVLVGFGGMFCLFATTTSFGGASDDRVLLWGNFIGIMANLAAGMTMFTLFRQYQRASQMQIAIGRLQDELKKCHPTGNAKPEVKDYRRWSDNSTTSSEAWRKALVEADGSLLGVSKCIEEIAHTISHVESDVMANDPYNDVGLKSALKILKKAVLTQEANMIQMVANELRRVPRRTRLYVTEDEWNRMLSRMPRAYESEICFEHICSGGQALPWKAAREILATYTEVRLRRAGRQLDEIEGPDENSRPQELPVRARTVSKAELEYKLKQQMALVCEMKRKYEAELLRMRKANSEDHAQIQNLVEQLVKLRRELDGPVLADTAVTDCSQDSLGPEPIGRKTTGSVEVN